MTTRTKKKKIGRNDPCPCGSGKKYKRCHGSLENSFSPLAPPSANNQLLAKKIKEIEALQKQREQQQGRGRPIISIPFKGYRFVAVGSRLHYSKNWKTFHDFLFDYIKISLGGDWGNAELKKPYEERHPVLQWYALVCKIQKEHFEEPGKIHTTLVTGAIAAYLGLAYNLYLLAHNVEIQKILIDRLKNINQFHGAYYETYVAAAFIKAGFDLEFEEETDPSRKHCEFTATFKQTGRRFSVEAKARLPNKTSAKIGNQLYNALLKDAKHRRVVFVDVNVPDKADDAESAAWLEETLINIRLKEQTMTIAGTPAPAAYLFVTNHPYQYNLETTSFRRAVLAEGFKIPDFKMDSSFRSIKDALSAREKHYEMFQLMESIKTHYEIPSTFDGEIPEFAFGDTPARLKIGHRYLVPCKDGTEVPGTLTAATVSEKEQLVYGAYKLDDGRSIIASCPLTEEELSAYKRYPDTFFGVYHQQVRHSKNPLEMFDWLYENYRHTSKGKLLEFLRDHPDFDKLRGKSQKELAITYCEGLVYSIMNPKDSKQREKKETKKRGQALTEDNKKR